jgi:iron complex transport system ATP-binding protein
MMLEAIHLACGRGPLPARAPSRICAVLEEVSFSVAPGELIAVIGINGAGKSTLLQTLAGLLPPLAGEVRWQGQPLSLLPRRERAKSVAYLAQNPAIEGALTVRDTVMLGRYPYRRLFLPPSAGDEQAVEQAMMAADVATLAGRSLHSLSGGERGRVLLARALAVQPELLLADEPASGLDIAHQLAMLEHFQRLAAEGMTVITALHDISLALRYCDRLLLLSGRRLVCDLSAVEVVAQPEILAPLGVRWQVISTGETSVLVPVSAVSS